eukprot:TRINITY_DN179_c7_g1_i1.p2 TRINITY_DN179_c7_g1~~TRINITY_DN179_c7_g1_i1.p2  ORF type:complete len:671 (+),score=61.58 TRINITY_DN179_c7_g1_i1:3753-5765(+)
MKVKTVLSITLIIIMCACEKDKEIVIDTSLVETRDAKVQEEGGVILSGSINSQNSFKDHGFVLSQDSLFSSYPTWIYYLGAPGESGVFEKEVNSGLNENQTYFFKAFIETDERKFFGKVESFISKGSKAPQIKEVVPHKAHIEDTISIVGNNFGRDNQFVSLRFGGIRPKIIGYSDTLIKCQVPKNIDSHDFKLVLNCRGKSVSTTYTLFTPEIESFTPAQITFRDTVWISGKHFDFATSRNHIHLGELEAEIISSGRNKIAFVVPDELDSEKIEINLESQLQKVQSQETLNLLSPEISSIPESVYSKTEILIKGNYFHPVLHKNEVLIEGIEAKIISGSKNELKVQIPYGPFPRGYADMQINIGSLSEKSSKDMYISDKWLMISNSLPFSYYREAGTFTIQGTAYVMSNSRDYSDDRTYLWEYMESTNEWIKHDIPFEIKGFEICACTNDKGYVYTATNENNFWEFDPQTKQWTERMSFPGARRDGAAAFSLGNDIYIGTGVDFEPYDDIAYRDFYCYKPDSNTWTRIEDLGMDRYWERKEASTFVINDIAYLLGGATNTGMFDVWSYSLTTKKWKQMADFPYAMHYTSSFSLNGKGYLANGSTVGGMENQYCWEYTPENDTWRKFYNIGHKGRYGGFSFVVNNTAYAGGGSGGSYNDLTEYELYRMRE